MNVKYLHILKYFAFGTLIGMVGIFFAYHIVYAKTIIPGIYVSGMPVGGTAQETAYKELKITLDTAQRQELTLDLIPADSTKGPLRKTLLPKELGLAYQPGKTIQNAYLAGRSGGFMESMKTKWQAWAGGINLPIVYSVDQEVFTTKIDEIISQVGTPAISAKFVLVNSKVTISPSFGGLGVSSGTMIERVTEGFLDLERNSTAIILNYVEPKTTSNDLKYFLSHVSTAVKSPPQLRYNKITWQPTSEQILSFLTVTKNSQTKLTTDEEAISEYVQTIASQIDRIPKGQILTVENNKVIDFIPSQTGQTLNKPATTLALSQTLLHTNNTPIELVVEITQPPEGDTQYGIKEKIGEGESQFHHSIPNRIYNIQLSSSILDGILLPPGEEFSFSKYIGDVSTATGYKQAYVIAKGQTILGAGGGLCQVSTTMYRAALYSGLPITERYAHDYRVHYYEPPSGMDATIYTPSPDLKFVNDTPAYILIKTEFDLPTETLKFVFYGTDDGRVTEISDPIMTNVIPPPEARNQETDTLAKGVVNRVEWAVSGADVTVYRTVTRGEELLQDDTFFSRYKAWGEVNLVGTRE